MVSRDKPSDDMLILINDSMVSSSILSETTTIIGYMLQKDSLSTIFLQLLKLLLEPAEHISSILESVEVKEVHVVADIGVQGNQLGLSHLCSILFSEWNRVVTIVKEVLNLLLILDELGPGSSPLSEVFVITRIEVREMIGRERVMVTDRWEHADAAICKVFLEQLSDILDDFNIRLES
jgi:hypothetical protein